jgi:hypothetical protein
VIGEEEFEFGVVIGCQIPATEKPEIAVTCPLSMGQCRRAPLLMLGDCAKGEFGHAKTEPQIL